MKKITYKELAKIFCDYESNVKDGSHLSGYVVFTENSFKDYFSLEARTYSVSSDNKAFQPDMGGYSIFGSAIDGSDPLVRLERYMAAEQGGKNGWKVDYCYLDEDFCVNCREEQPYATYDFLDKITVQDITFEYSEVRAYCTKCGKPMYVPKINDINARHRERAFLNEKKRLELAKEVDN